MSNLSISLLGAFEATLAERRLTAFETQKTQALLIYLVCQPEQAHPREALMTLLWPDMLLSSAQANMRQTLYRLRKLIPEVAAKSGGTPVPFLLSSRQTIQINPDADYFLDVAILDKGDPTQAITLYRGDFLADFYLPDSEPFEEWVAGQRAAYRRWILEILAAETAVHLQSANYDEAIQLAQRQLEIDNLRESSHRQLMEAWARDGRRREALTHYDSLCHLLQTELAIEPEPETLALVEAIRAGELSRATPVYVASSSLSANEPESPKHNMPHRLTSFVGREKEMAAIAELIRQNRLVMLTGVGGIGKTNLCLQVGQMMLGVFPEGVWFIELTPVADPALVAQTAAHTLGLRSVSDVPILEVMLNYLKTRACLLILDNCEHVIEEAAQLAQTVLQACPDVKILASSREALSISGEIPFQVPSLVVPQGTQQISAEDWPQYEAIRLFVDRAKAVLPHFQVMPENIASLVQICQRLDGIPLALELAAARAKVLTTAQIAARLDDRFRLLTGGSRTALPRHQTLYALIDWSWELLAPDEQLLLQRLSVFQGGMELEAVEAVCAGDDLDVYDLLDLLSELVNKSLVVARREQGQETQYRLLETIRHYAQEKLTQAGQRATFRQRHLAYFAGLGQLAEKALVGPDQGIWIKRLEREFDNIRAALSLALEVEPEAGLRLANCLYRFWAISSLSEGLSLLTQLLTRAESPAPETKAKALWVRGMLGLNVLKADTVHQLAEESLALYQHLEDQQGVANALMLLGNVISWHQGFHKGRPYFQEGLTLFTELGDLLGASETLLGWGFFEGATFNNYAEALVLLKESEQLCRELGHLAGVVDALVMSANMAIWHENYSLAHLMLDESQSLLEQLGRKGAPNSFLAFGRLYFWLGKYPQARTYLEQCLSLYQQWGDNNGMVWALVWLGYAVLRQNEQSEARAILIKCLEMYQETGIVTGFGVIFVIEGFASLAVRQKNAKRATCLFAWTDASRKAFQNVRPINEQKGVDRDMAVIREMIDEEVFDAAYAEGKAMTVEEAIAYALEEGTHENG